MIHHEHSGPRPMPFQAPQGDLAVLAGSANQELSKAIARSLGLRLTPAETHTFSDGNVFVRVLENVRGRDCFIIQGVHHPVNDNFMELLFWIDALKRASAQSVTAVIPYFSYAKGDKKDEPRVSIRARVCADAIEEAGADRCLMMDLHSPQIQGFFQIPVDHLYGRYVLAEHISSMGIDNLVICSPDVGFAKGASAFAKLLGVPVVIGNKERTDHTEQAEVLEIIGDVKGKNVVIVDDFTISGGTLISMAELLKARGANDIYAAVSHAALTESAGPKITASPITKLFTTDTIEPLPKKSCEKLQIVSVAEVFAAAIRSVHDRTSVSMLFPENPKQK
ncbi:ribose-phosphate diphosphokinase [Rubinisphaera italica]|uniref:ribose-phosphate diphosphokinase n=1 Tax=Rubinisphaera italica TaxID=2527969 RepID=A0A5C5XFS2_9PLAN|nr:ribose-phosphate pyrophosphokinase [Rubinisphaera italica]TWT61608.1 Ribose-phosphate pyrophosphokinase [Rubinisphaera italica]